MATDKDYISAISKMGRQELIQLWKNRRKKEVKSFWEPGKALEYILLRAFELEDATVRWPYNVRMSNDDNNIVEQIDGSIQFEYFYILVECKDYEKAVNIEPFAKMRNQLMRRPSTVIGCIFSTNGFSDPALALSKFVAPQTILLWEGDEFEYCLEHCCFIKGLKKKFSMATEEFAYNYNIKEYFSNQQIDALWEE